MKKAKEWSGKNCSSETPPDEARSGTLSSATTVLSVLKSEAGVDPHRCERSAGLTEVKGGGADLLICLPLSAFIYSHAKLLQLKVMNVGHLKWLITNSLL